MDMFLFFTIPGKTAVFIAAALYFHMQMGFLPTVNGTFQKTVFHLPVKSHQLKQLFHAFCLCALLCSQLHPGPAGFPHPGAQLSQILIPDFAVSRIFCQLFLYLCLLRYCGNELIHDINSFRLLKGICV